MALSTLLRGRPEWEARLAFPGYIYVSNWHAWAMPLLCALLLSRADGVRRRVVAGLLTLAGGACLFCADPLVMRPRLHLAEGRTDAHGVCLQSSSSSCGPAAAATFVSALGISTTEREMAELCLARAPIGVTPLGLYRGIRAKLRHTEWRCRMARLTSREVMDRLSCLQNPFSDKRQVSQFGEGAGLLFDARIGSDASAGLRRSWLPGIRHLAVIFGMDEHGRAVVGDPSFGLESWPMKHFESLFEGLVIEAERRTPSTGGGTP